MFGMESTVSRPCRAQRVGVAAFANERQSWYVRSVFAIQPRRKIKSVRIGTGRRDRDKSIPQVDRQTTGSASVGALSITETERKQP